MQPAGAAGGACAPQPTSGTGRSASASGGAGLIAVGPGLRIWDRSCSPFSATGKKPETCLPMRADGHR
jgi:hypothetical protein